MQLREFADWFDFGVGMSLILLSALIPPLIRAESANTGVLLTTTLLFLGLVLISKTALVGMFEDALSCYKRMKMEYMVKSSRKKFRTLLISSNKR